MLGLDFDMETFPQETGHDVDLFLNGSYEQPIMPSTSFEQYPTWEQGIPFEQGAVSDIASLVQITPVVLPASWSAPAQASTPSPTLTPSSTKRSHAPVERETKVKKRKQQHQQKDKERRHRINDGLRQLGTLVQSSTGAFTKLDQPTIVSSSINLITSLQNELVALRAQLASKGMEEKTVVTKSEAHGQHEGACPIFSSLAGAGVALVMIRADDLCIVEANSTLANILGYTDPVAIVGTAVWDKPLHSRLYQLDRHGRVVNDNSNPFAFGEAKVKNEDSDYSVKSEDAESHIDCLWTARTANGNTLSARVTLSVQKGRDGKPTHFLLCSLPSQRQVTPGAAAISQNTALPEIEVAA